MSIDILIDYLLMMNEPKLLEIKSKSYRLKGGVAW